MLVKSMREFEDVIIYEKYKDDAEREQLQQIVDNMKTQIENKKDNKPQQQENTQITEAVHVKQQQTQEPQSQLQNEIFQHPYQALVNGKTNSAMEIQSGEHIKQ